jgi:DnaA initiator-associating protein
MAAMSGRARDISTLLTSTIEQSIATFESLRQLEPPLRQAADALAGCLTSGGKLLICGNGGSAAMRRISRRNLSFGS